MVTETTSTATIAEFLKAVRNDFCVSRVVVVQQGRVVDPPRVGDCPDFRARFERGENM